MGDKVDVQVDGIEEFSKTSDKRGDRFDEVIEKLEGAKVGRESFGKMPSSGDIFAQYEERVSGSMEDLKECVEAMRDIGKSMAGTAETYRGVDGGGATFMQDVMTGLDGISVPQVGR